MLKNHIFHEVKKYRDFDQISIKFQISPRHIIQVSMSKKCERDAFRHRRDHKNATDADKWNAENKIDASGCVLMSPPYPHSKYSLIFNYLK